MKKVIRNIRLVSAAIVPASLKAAIVVTSPEVSIVAGGNPIAFDLPTGQVAADGTFPTSSSFALTYSFGAASKPLLQASGSVAQVSAVSLTDNGSGGYKDFAVKYTLSQSIDGSARWSGDSFLSKPNYAGLFPVGTRGYVGLQLNQGSDINYGWADVSYNNDSSLTLHRFAYESTPFTSIQAGAVPEPSSAFAAALAAGSFAAFRARRRILARCQALV